MVDRYTKGVLTVIAGCLLWLCVMSVGKPVEAQRLGPAQPVVIVGWGEMSPGGEVTLNFKRQPDGTRVTDATFPVRLPYSAENRLPVALDRGGPPLPVTVNSAIKLAYTNDAPLPIGVTAIKRTRDWDSIDTTVLPGPRTTLPGQPEE